MKLAELEPRLLNINEPGLYGTAESLAEAQGIMFLCPKCFAARGGNVGTHSILCWFTGRGVPDDLAPKPGRWVPSGIGIDDLTFIGPAAASVLLQSPAGCRAHFKICNGEIVNCP
jgi:hypothetical protein